MDRRKLRNRAFKDEAGNQYGRLTVIEFHSKRKTPSGQGKTYWRCLCSCGKETITQGNKLRNGESRSCGCLKIERISNLTRLSEEERAKRLIEPRKCTKCLIVYPPTEFKHINHHHCHKCVALQSRKYSKRRSESGKALAQDLKKKYNLTRKQYDDMALSQNGMCAICNKPPTLPRLHVDHDHSLRIGHEYFVRGLLCDSCNKGIGFLGDNLELLKKAVAYLEKHIHKLQNSPCT